MADTLRPGIEYWSNSVTIPSTIAARKTLRYCDAERIARPSAGPLHQQQHDRDAREDRPVPASCTTRCQSVSPGSDRKKTAPSSNPTSTTPALSGNRGKIGITCGALFDKRRILQVAGARDCVIRNRDATNARSVSVALPAGFMPVT